MYLIKRTNRYFSDKPQCTGKAHVTCVTSVTCKPASLLNDEIDHLTAEESAMQTQPAIRDRLFPEMAAEKTRLGDLPLVWFAASVL